MAKTANEELVQPAKEEETLAPVSQGEDLAVDFNSNEEITAADLFISDEDGEFEDIKEADQVFGKHWRNCFYQRHPDPAWNSTRLGVIKLKNSSEIWVVHKDLCGSLKADGLQFARVYTLIDTENDILFEPIRVTRDGETLDTWKITAHQLFAEEYTTNTWFKIVSQCKGNRYVPRRAQDQDAWPKPVWPEGDFMTLLIEAVRERYINSKEHDVYRAIKGQKQK